MTIHAHPDSRLLARVVQVLAWQQGPFDALTYEAAGGSAAVIRVRLRAPAEAVAHLAERLRGLVAVREVRCVPVAA